MAGIDGYCFSGSPSLICISLKIDLLCVVMGVGTNFGVGVEEARPEGPRVGVGFLGRGQPAPPHQLGRLRERSKL